MGEATKLINAKMVLDATGYNNTIKGVNAETKKYQSAIKAASESVKTFGKDSEKLGSIQQALSKTIEAQNKKIEIYKKSIEDTNNKMQKNISSRDKLKASLEAANKKYNESIKIYGKESKEAQKAKEEVDKLSTEHKKAEKSVESNAKQIQKYETNLNKANAEMQKTQGQLNKVNKELDNSKNKWLKTSENLEKNSEKLKDAGSTISGVGNKILGLTAPFIAAGVAGSNFSMEFESSVAKVSTIADESQVSVEDLSKGILALSNDTGIASTEIANNVYDAISAGQQTGDALNFVTNSTKLAKAGFAEAGQSLDLLTTIMNSYGLEAEAVTQVSDTLIQTQNLGKTTVAELSSSMGKIIPTAKSLGVQLDQVATGYALMTAKGIATAETTTYMNSMFNELGKSGTTANKALQSATGQTLPDLIKKGKSVGDILNIMNEHAVANGKSLADMFGSAEAGKAALVLAEGAGKDFNNMLAQMQQSAGATDKAFKKVSSTSEERVTKNLNKLKNEAIRLGDALAPVLESGIELLGKVTDKISSMSDEQIQNIAKWGMMAVATGGAFKVIGGGISTVGSIAGGLGKLTGILGTASTATSVAGTAAGVAGGATGLGAMATGLGGVALAAAPYALAIGGVILAGKAVHDNMSKEVVPSIDLFADKVTTTYQSVETAQGTMQVATQQNTITISEETKKQVQAYLDLDQQATQSLNNLYISSSTITAQQCADVTTQYEQMSSTITTGLEADKQENLKQLNDFFAQSKAIADKEEQDILTKTNSFYEDKKKTVDDYSKQITNILEDAANEHRQITDAEKHQINGIQQQMKEQAVKTLSENEVEAQVILQRMKDYDGRVTAEQCSEHIKELNESRDKAVATANDEYDKRVATIVKMRDEAKVISAEQATALIADAKKTKDETVSAAETTRIDAVNKIRLMNSELENSVDTTTGEILTWWDKLSRWWTGWEPEQKSFGYTVTEQRRKIILDNPERYQNVPSENWTGNASFQGGLTYIHERGYELYDLPQGTRIYNHDASEQMVLNTAREVAEQVTSKMLGGFKGNGINVTQYINNPVSSPGEIARQTKNSLRELALDF